MIEVLNIILNYYFESNKIFDKNSAWANVIKLFIISQSVCPWQAFPPTLMLVVEARAQCYKTFYGRKLRLFIISQSVVPGNPFQSSLMFEGKAGAYPNETPFRCSTLGYTPGFIHKHQTRQEKIGKGKHSSLLRKFIHYGRKKFYNIDTWSLAGKSLVRDKRSNF